MGDLPTPPYREATGPQAEAKPSTEDLSGFGAHQPKVTDVDCGCDVCYAQCPGPVDVTVCSHDDEDWPCAVVSAYWAGRAQAAADIRAEAGRRDRLGYDDAGAWIAANKIAEGAVPKATGGVVGGGPVVRLGERGCAFPSGSILNLPDTSGNE